MLGVDVVGLQRALACDADWQGRRHALVPHADWEACRVAAPGRDWLRPVSKLPRPAQCDTAQLHCLHCPITDPSMIGVHLLDSNLMAFQVSYCDSLRVGPAG